MMCFTTLVFLVLPIVCLSKCTAGKYGYNCEFNCRCKDCDDVIGCMPTSRCFIGWSGPECRRLNAALNKDIVSNNIVGLEFPFAVNDGDRTELNCQHSDYWFSPVWIRIDLGKTIDIQSITIYFSTDEVSGYDLTKWIRAEIRLYVLDNPVTNPSGYIPCHIIPSINFDNEGISIHEHLAVPSCAGSQRYIFIYSESNNATTTMSFFDFCEVAAYTCDYLAFGSGCSRTCHCNVGSCDPGTGVCQVAECQDGWISERCDEECPVGTFGQNCSRLCGLNCLASECHHVTGVCSKCKDGWMGDFCLKKCEPGKYGKLCVMACGNCLDSAVCHHEIGTCLTGCEDGWLDHDCLTADGPNVALIGGIVATIIVVLLVGTIVAIVVVKRRRVVDNALYAETENDKMTVDTHVYETFNMGGYVNEVGDSRASGVYENEM